MAKNLIFGLILVHFRQIWSQKTFFIDFVSTKCHALLQAIILCNFKENYWTTLEKMEKNLVPGLILVPLAQIWAQKTFSIDFISTRC